MRTGITAAAALAALLVGLAATAGSAPAASPALASRLATALRAPGVDPARTSALAVDLRSGEVVFGHRASLALAPASTEKLAVAYAALARLGAGYRFRTEIAGTGRLVAGEWTGDLYLRGLGDPTLTAADLDGLAAQISAWGIRRVRGAVLGDESWFDATRDAPGWKPGWVGLESPPLGALVVDRARGWPGLAASLLAARALDAALERRGISVAKRPGRGAAPPAAMPLAQHLSVPLADIVRAMNRESDNFTAEMLLRELGAAAGGGGTTAAGAAVVREALAVAGVPLGGVRIADGSGLSTLDRLSARALVALLLAADREPAMRDAFATSLAVAGVSGTLERRLARKPTYGQVIAKTGTTSGASSLAGYVRGRYAFAIVQNGSPVPWLAARDAQDRFVTVLASG